MVSPILASDTVLMLANMNPTSPADSSSQGSAWATDSPGPSTSNTCAVGPQPDLLPHAHAAVHHARQDDHAAIGIEPGIENQRAQRRVGRALGRRHQVHDGLQNFVNADALLGAHQQRAARVQPDHGFDLLANALRLGGGQIDLVDDRNDFQVVVQRQIGIGQRLRLHALRRVHHQQRAFAGLQAARNLVGEIHVARRVDQVELIHRCRRRRG